MARKLNNWVKTAIFVFVTCVVSFGLWLVFDDGQPTFALWLSIVTFIVWGYATSKGFRVGIYKDE